MASHMIGLSSVLIFSIVGACTSEGSLTERNLELVSCSAASMFLLRLEGQPDRCDALPHVRLDVLDALHRDHRLLDRVDDLRSPSPPGDAPVQETEMVSTGCVASGSWLTPR